MAFRDFTRAFAKEATDSILRELSFIAEGCYEQAVRHRQFADDTGALLSSMGWGVCRDGSVVYSGGFEGANSLGKARGQELLSRAARSSKGISLVLVAGMAYASHVEAKGYDVNTSGELLAEEMIKWWLSYA